MTLADLTDLGLISKVIITPDSILMDIIVKGMIKTVIIDKGKISRGTIDLVLEPMDTINSDLIYKDLVGINIMLMELIVPDVIREPIFLN